MSLLLIFAFISGLITILAPCIWPLLPIILSATATGGHKKPLGITIGIIISFGVFTLTISYLVKLISFDPSVLRLFAVVVIGLLGLTLLIPKFSSVLEGYVSRFSGKFSFKNSGSGFWSGVITGIALGLVWTPCAGPILATIATLSATTQVNSGVVLVTLFYIVGVGIPLFLFATFGRKLFLGSKKLTPYLGKIQQVFGGIMILTSVLIFTNYDKILQAKLLDIFPAYGNFLIQFESNPQIKDSLEKLKSGKDTNNMIGKPFDMPKNNSLPSIGTASELTGITNWINSNPLTLEQLKGKVVLIDFWTYTCINCIRTLPHVTSWYEKYKDQGFVVLGIHTPEFEFEKNTSNVINATKQYKINYPVAQDNDYATWNAYSNRYWPAKYLIDTRGTVRYVHYGEGEYDKTEIAIRSLLKENGVNISSNLIDIPSQSTAENISKETYLGASRMQYFFPNGGLSSGQSDFSLNQNPPKNTFSLGGTWNIENENAISVKNATLSYNFYADKVFLVLRPGGNPSTVKVYLDGKLITDENAGDDVVNGVITISKDRLYNLIDLKSGPEEHILKLEFSDGIKAFAFTFG